MSKRAIAGIFILTALPTLITGCGEERISYSQNVEPILEKHCTSCHVPGGSGYSASGLRMTSYEELMAGTDGGPMIIPRDVQGSNLVVLMEGRADPSISMPHGSLERVPSEQIAIIKKWIAQGAKNN